MSHSDWNDFRAPSLHGAKLRSKLFERYELPSHGRSFHFQVLLSSEAAAQLVSEAEETVKLIEDALDVSSEQVSGLELPINGKLTTLRSSDRAHKPISPFKSL